MDRQGPFCCIEFTASRRGTVDRVSISNEQHERAYSNQKSCEIRLYDMILSFENIENMKACIKTFLLHKLTLSMCEWLTCVTGGEICWSRAEHSY